MSLRYSVAVFLLVVWILLGPIAMAFAGCALAGAMCKDACGASSCALPGVSALTAPAPVSFLSAPAESGLLTIELSGLEPPPKFPIRSA